MNTTDTTPSTVTSKPTVTTHDTSTLSDDDLTNKAQEELNMEDDVVEVRFDKLESENCYEGCLNLPTYVRLLYLSIYFPLVSPQIILFEL